MKRPVGGVWGFHGGYRFLSNFFIEPDGSHVEGEYQRAKCYDFLDRARFDGLSPVDAKRFGRTVMMRPDWEDVKLDIMTFYVTKKFKDHPRLAEQLRLIAGPIIHENTHGDRFWGTVNGKGLNILGDILMGVREEAMHWPTYRAGYLEGSNE